MSPTIRVITSGVWLIGERRRIPLYVSRSRKDLEFDLGRPRSGAKIDPHLSF